MTAGTILANRSQVLRCAAALDCSCLCFFAFKPLKYVICLQNRHPGCTKTFCQHFGSFLGDPTVHETANAPGTTFESPIYVS